MKNLKQFKDKNLYKIHIPTSIESWTEYIIAKDENEAKLAQEILELTEHKLEYVTCFGLGMDSMWYFENKNKK